MATRRGSPVKDVGRQFRVGELARALDVDARRVKGWVEQGFIRPTLPGRGPGQPRRFDIEQLAWATMLLALQAAFGQKSPVPPQVMHSRDLTLIGLVNGDSPQAYDSTWEDGDEIFYVVQYDAARRVPRYAASLVFERDVPHRLSSFTKPGHFVTMIPMLPFIRPIRERLGLPWPGRERDWVADIEGDKALEALEREEGTR